MNNENTNLKDEIVGAIVVEMDKRFESVNVEMDKRFGLMNKEMDKRFGLMNKETDSRFQSMKKEIVSEMDDRFNVFESRITGEMEDGFRQQGVLLEDMQGDIDTLVEGQELIQQRIDRLHGVSHGRNETFNAIPL